MTPDRRPRTQVIFFGGGGGGVCLGEMDTLTGFVVPCSSTIVPVRLSFCTTTTTTTTAGRLRGRRPSDRGAGVEFGPDVTNQFCITNSIALVLRSHECVQEGYEVLHDGRLITIFSASRYCGTQTNKGNHFCSLSCVVVVVVGFLFVVGRW